MPEPTEPKPSADAEKPSPKPRRSWLRRIGRGLLWILLLVAIFHRPLFHTGARFALIMLAKRNNVTLDVHFSGTIFTNLTVRDVRATPNGKGPTPVEKIAIESVHLEYSIPMLVKHGVGEFLRSYEIRHADLVFIASPDETEEEKKKKKTIAEDLNNLLAQPALYADRARIHDFNITIRSEKDVTEVRGFDALFHPWEVGFLRIARVKVPGLPVWENLSAKTSYANRNLTIEGLELSPELVIDMLNFDASRRAEDKGSMQLKARVFGGTLELSLAGAQLQKKGENLARSYDTVLTIAAADVDIQATAAYFGADKLPPMRLAALTTRFRGEPEKPRTWNGDVGVRVEGLTFGTTTLDAVGAQLVFRDGQARISTGDLSAFGAMVALTGTANLPETVNDFSGTEGDVAFTLKVPDLLTATRPFLAEQPIAGAAGGSGKVTLRNRHLNADVALTATGAGNAQYGVASLDLEAMATKSLDAKGTWFNALNLQAALNAKELRFSGFTADSAVLRAELQGDLLMLRAAEIVRGENRLAANGTYRMPAEGSKGLGPMAGEFSVKVPDLASFGVGAKGEALSGKIEGAGKVSTGPDNTIRGELGIEASAVAFGEQYAVSSLKVQASGSKALEATGEWFNGIAAQAELDGKELRYSTFNADSASARAEMRDELLTVHAAEVIAGENRVAANGTYRLPKEGSTGAGPMDSEFTIKVPDLKAFGLGAKGEILSGRINGSGKLATGREGRLGGNVELEGSNFAFGKFTAARLGAKIVVANDEARIDEFVLQIDKTNRIAVTGKAGVQKPFAYEGALLVIFKDLAALQPLLGTFGVTEKLTGVLDLSAESSGTLQPQEHAGQLKLSVDRAAYGKIDLKEARIAGIFGPGFAESTELRLVSGATSFQGGLEWREKKLKLRDIVLQQGNLPALTGFVVLPFDPQNREQPIAFDKRIAANVNAKDLDIEKLMATFGKPAPVSGTITANLLAGGTLLRPTAHVKVAARGIKAKAAAKLDAAEIDLTAHYSENELTLDTVARQKNIQPLTIKGRVPLDLEAAIQQKKLDPNLPLDLTVRLPSSSLAFLPTVVPALRRIEGTAGIDARVGGTVEKPQFSGAAAVKIEFARMKQESVPAIGGFQADVAFTNDSVTLRRFRGEVGGGTFEVLGGAKFPKITEPVLDIRVRSDEVLVKRDDSVTVRVDTDVSIAGPLAKAAVGGTVWVTNSRFFRDIDILPIALPGRPKPRPEPKSVPTEKTLSFEKPPLRDWTFDVAIKTRPDNLFQIRGNLANGTAAIDLKFAGTGLEPYLEGSVRVENFVASLPFSRLEVSRGFVTFSRDAPFEPKLDIMAESQLRDYRINAYIYGTAKDPQLSLTSEPPLPQQDLLALLATGTTTAELTGNSDVLASRAAALLFQQLYRKVFKKNDPLQKVPVLDRLNLEVGAVDSKTGRQEIATSFRLGENLYLVGDVDVTGQFTGRVKYLLRFR